MRIQPINPPVSDRYIPDVNDRAWLVMRNDGSGATGLLQARAGDVTCLHIDETAAAVYTDVLGNTRLAGYCAIECETTKAPPHLLLGAWHDTPAVGKFGRVQCSGWDDDALVTLAAGPLPDTGDVLSVVTGVPALNDPAVVATTDLEAAETGALAILVTPNATLDALLVSPGAGDINMDVWWRCL